MSRTAIVLYLAIGVCGCAETPSQVKGRLLENGQPLVLPVSSTPQSVVLVPLAADGQTETGRMYSAIIDSDGTFELVAAGGAIPPGFYKISLDVAATGKAGEKFKQFRGSGSPLRKELKPGVNDFTIDLAKPEG
ncbi:MAG: hypothetical protein K8U57_16490 [Planctomycetes bacterium]|nr:hypothetical protein [Planctomycetota bacterium]